MANLHDILDSRVADLAQIATTDQSNDAGEFAGTKGRKLVGADGKMSRASINKAIIRNEGAPPGAKLTVQQLATELGCSKNIVYEQRHKLKMKGLLSRAAAITMDDIAERAKARETPTYDRESRVRKLAFIMEHGSADQKMKAIDRLEEIEARHEQRIGPPPPETDQEAEDRLLRIALAAPRDCLRRVLHRIDLALQQEEHERAAEQQPAPEEIAPEITEQTLEDDGELPAG